MSAPAPVQFVTMSVEDLEALAEAAACRALAKAATSNAGGNDWLDSKGAAKMLSLCTRTVARLAKDKQIPSTHVGRLLRFRRTDLLAYLARG